MVSVPWGLKPLHPLTKLRGGWSHSAREGFICSDGKSGGEYSSHGKPLDLFFIDLACYTENETQREEKRQKEEAETLASSCPLVAGGGTATEVCSMQTRF